MTRYDGEYGELDVAARLDAHGLTAAARAVVRHRQGLQLGDEEHTAVADAARQLLAPSPPPRRPRRALGPGVCAAPAREDGQQR